MIEQWEARWSDDWVRMRLHCSFSILQGVGAQQGLNKGAPIACIWCFLKLSSVICAPPAFLRFERKCLTEIAHDRWHIIAQNVLLIILISNASIISLHTDNVCVSGKWDKRTGHNAPLRPRWNPVPSSLSADWVQIKISYSLRLIINEHVLAANLICVHCLGTC